jgi:cell division protein FtsL
MTRINLVLLLAVIASAMYLVSVQYDSRRLFTELDRVTAESHKLETEFERLQVEKRAQATPGRVEKIAREKLQMRQATPAITTYVNYTAAGSFASSQDASAAAPASSTPSASGSAAIKPVTGGNP